MLTHLTDTLITLITNLYATAGLAGIIIAMAIESCCIPLPSEVVMPLAGIMLARGKLLPGINPLLSLLLVALAGSLGCLIGSIVAYWIGYSGGRPLLLKYGRYLLISQHDADRADRFFQRWGSATTFFSRLLPIIRTYISLPAGISRMSFKKFCLYTFLGSFPWCLLLAYIGTIIGGNLNTLSPIFHDLDGVILAALVILVALYIWRHIRNDRLARAAHAHAAANPSQQGWEQPQPQQPWQPPSQFQPPPQQQAWGQPPQSQQPWQPPSQFQSPPQQAWGQPPQQGWGQPTQRWPSPAGDTDSTIRRN